MKKPFTSVNDSIERTLAAIGVLLAHHENGHHGGCLSVVSGGGGCDCGYEAALAELAEETKTLRAVYRIAEERRALRKKA